jgi:uncharacterized protein (TIGR03437 family)
VSATTLSYIDGAVPVIVGGQNAQVLFAGLAPGYVGLYQVCRAFRLRLRFVDGL